MKRRWDRRPLENARRPTSATRQLLCGAYHSPPMRVAEGHALRSSRRSKGAGVRAPRRLPLRVCLPASEIWRTEDKADRLKQGARARALLPHASVGNGTHRAAAGASLGSACASPALALTPLSAVVFPQRGLGIVIGEIFEGPVSCLLVTNRSIANPRFARPEALH